jgi:PAS domain S-box-containing protein
MKTRMTTARRKAGPKKRRSSERRQQQAEEVRRNLAAIVEQSEDAIIGGTPDGIITSWNRGAERIYGYSASEMIGQSVAILYPPDRLREFEMVCERTRRGERIEHFETVRRAKNGLEVFISLSISPIRDDKGKVVAASVIARDVTARHRAQEALRRSEEGYRQLNTRLEELVRERTAQLEAANKELEAFAYSVSHDLRAPLRAIDGFSLALVEEFQDQLDETGRRYVERVRAATHRMGALIDALIELSRVSRSQLERTPMDISACAREIVAELRQTPNHRAVEMIIQPDLIAQADPRLVRIALYNLLDNAWKFTQHTAQPRIEFGQCERDQQKWFFVRDNGAGFEMAYAGKLFGAFQRLHSAKEYEGTGIGLATVQRIIHRHGGSVRAEGATGQGATFSFTLPDADSL